MTDCQAAWCDCRHRGVKEPTERLWVSLVRSGEHGPIFDQRRRVDVCAHNVRRLKKGVFVYMDRVAMGLKSDRTYGQYQYCLLSIRYWRHIRAKGRWLAV